MNNPYGRCYNLANLFAEDYYPHLADDKRVSALAALIQKTIMDWLARQHDNYDGPNDSPQDDPDFAGFAENH